jgi:hypothetical protein
MRFLLRQAAAVAALAVLAAVIALARPAENISPAASLTSTHLATSKSNAWSRP